MKQVLDKEKIIWYYVKVTDWERSERYIINIIKKLLDRQGDRWYDIKVDAEQNSPEQQNKSKSSWQTKRTVIK